MQAFNALLSKIKQEQFSPFYLLSGTESYYIDAITDALVDQLVTEQSRDFDFTVFYGKDAVTSEIIEQCFSFIIIITLCCYHERQYQPNHQFL